MSSGITGIWRRAVLLTSIPVLVVLSGSSGALADTCCQAPTVGDVDGSRDVDIADVAVMIDHLFLTLTPLSCKDEGNFNYPGGWYAPADTIIDITDLQIMIEGQFLSMTPYPPCPPDFGEPSGSLIHSSGCKGPLALAATSDSITADQSCIVWDYDGTGLLTLTHINAGFNCCPTLDISVDIGAGTITLYEVETLGECFCLCLFDLEFEIVNLPSGTYRLVAEEDYVSEGMEKIDFFMDLTQTPEGVHCVERTVYPWGVYETGTVSDR